MKKYITLTALLSAALAWTACSDELRGDGGTLEEGDAGAETYLRLEIRCPEQAAAGVQTRSNPTGGENGDGHEPGQIYETEIEDILLLFYQGSDGVNSPAATPIDKILYFNREEMGSADETKPLKVGLPGGEYDLLVITNTGDLAPQLKGKRLGDVRDYLQRQAWTEKGGSYSRFVMSSDGHTDDRVTLCGANTVDNPACATVEVERHAARVDYRAVADGYTVNDSRSGKAHAVITGALLVNNLTAGSYMLKRVQEARATDGEYADASTTRYLGLELPEFGDHQTNYVIDPWSYLKTLGNIDRSLFNAEAPGRGTAPLRALYGNYLTAYGTSTTAWRFPAGLGEPVGDWLRVGYTLENAVSKANQSRFINTGVVFRANYIPAAWLAYDAASGKVGEAATEGSKPFTFFAFQGKIYASVEAAMAAYAPAGTDLFSYSFVGKTWADVQSLIGKIRENDPAGYRYFLRLRLGGKLLADRLTDAEAAALAWDAYMQSTFGYTNNADGVTINGNGKDTRRLLARYGLHTYADGVCYYPYWIRHSNNNAADKGIMEYAIVRNNIYKLRISDIYGLGSDIPYEPPFEPQPDPDDPGKPDEPDDPDEPDEPDNPGSDDAQLKVEVEVVDWTKLADENIHL